MTETGDNDRKSAKPAKPGSRDARLAAALRENLRRRKTQERGRAASDGPGGGDRLPGKPGGENR